MPELLASLERLEPLLAGVWRASWQASVLALLVLAIQLILRERLSARWRYRLWMLVLIRLALPVTPPSPMSLFNLAPKFEPLPAAAIRQPPVGITVFAADSALVAETPPPPAVLPEERRKQVTELREVLATVLQDPGASIATFDSKIIVTASSAGHDNVTQILKTLQEPEKVGQ